MRAPHPGFVGAPAPLPGAAAPSHGGGCGVASVTTRRPGRVLGGPLRRSLRASATPPAGPATAATRTASATAGGGSPSRRARPEGGGAAAAAPAATPTVAGAGGAPKRRAAGAPATPGASLPAPPTTPTIPTTPSPLSSAAAADAASRAAAAAYTANLGTVIETLRADYPHLLTRPPVGTIYTPDVAFVSAGLNTAGVGAYGALWWAVRSAARLVLVGGEVAITSLYADAAAGRVYVRWRLTGVLRGGGGGGSTPDVAGFASRAGGTHAAPSGQGGSCAAAGGTGSSGGGSSDPVRGAPPGGGGGGGRLLIRDGMSVYTVGPAGLVVKHELVGASPTHTRLPMTKGVVDLWGGVLAGGGVGGGRLAGAGSGAGGGRGWRHERREGSE